LIEAWHAYNAGQLLPQRRPRYRLLETSIPLDDLTHDDLASSLQMTARTKTAKDTDNFLVTAMDP
jgi:hypothetical protein